MSSAAINAFFENVGGEPNADNLATAFAAHLPSITTAQLPADAQAVWRDIARAMKFAAEKPVPPKAIAALRSWPAQRVAELIEQLRRLNALLEAHENERLEDEIRDSIRHHYL